MTHAAALEEIAQSEMYADLGPTTARNARSLLRCASESNGSVHRTYEEMRKLFGVKGNSTVRRHLGIMMAAKLLKYRLGGIGWYVTFLAWENRP